MTEIELKDPYHEVQPYCQLDILFEIYRLIKIRKKLKSKLESLKKQVKSGITLNIQNKFEAIKTYINEKESQLKSLIQNLNPDYNLYDLSKQLNETRSYLENLTKERKRGRVDLEHYELTRGHYLQKIIDIQENLKRLEVLALSYFDDLREEIKSIEDQRIGLKTERLRKKIQKEDFKKNLKKVETKKHKIEEKLAFLKVEIIDYKFD
ncbi:MAG: hypothetical protein ACXAEX_15585 [Promethearchaeota archaeon]|jgi:chromosome segregation ATPase